MSTDQPIETFRSVLGFPLYRVSDWGRVQSCASPNGQGASTDHWHDLKPAVEFASKGGYLYVTLCHGYTRRNFKVHRLVLEAFVGIRPRGYVACHNDGNPTNNLLGNLRWDTIKNNHADKQRHGTSSRGSRNGMAKLTEAKVIKIRQLGDRGMTRRELSEQFRVSRSLISMILLRQIWAHL